MSSYPNIFEVPEESGIRVKQSHCCHPSLRCSLCHLFVDLVYEQQQRTIREQAATIAALQEELAFHTSAGILSGVPAEPIAGVQCDEAANAGLETEPKQL